MQDDNIVLFGPKNGKALRRSYPELDEKPVFKISNEDLLFAWMIGIEGSPVDNEWAEPTRYLTAASKAIKDPVKRQKYTIRDIPEEVKQAIKAFENMSPDARLIAKQMNQRILRNYEIIVDQDANNMDPDTWKKYVDTTQKIHETIPGLLKTLEEGFGITEKEKSESGIIGSRSIDKYHSSRKNI